MGERLTPERLHGLLAKHEQKPSKQDDTEWWIAYHIHLSSPAWKATRQQILARCGGVCERCAERKVQNIHHITYRNLGHEPLTDLSGLCRPCHREVHGLDTAKRKPKDPHKPRSRRQKRNDLRLKAIKIGVPVDLLKPLHNKPMPTPKTWDFKQTLIDSLNR